MIEAYFDDLEERIEFLNQLNQGGRKDEALMLCCCYIEAIGSRKYYHSDRKGKNFAKILEKASENTLFSMIHPAKLLGVLKCIKLFKKDLVKIEPLIEKYGKTLQSQEEVLSNLQPVMSPAQITWCGDNFFKGTIAAITYDLVRSELVHDISIGEVTFSETIVNGKLVPDLNFDLLFPALVNIFLYIKNESMNKNKWYWEL